jgi:hypothetical protein
MDIFHWVAVVLSTILGLGIARILSGYVIAFKSRHRAKIDWLPLLVTAIILGEILQFWWALAELSGRGQWSLADFTLLVALAMLLFLAAALIVPTDTELADPGKAFEHDGRWSLLVLAAFHAFAILVNWWFWAVSPLAFASLIIWATCIVSAAGALTPHRQTRKFAILLYCVLAVGVIFTESPLAY